MCLNDPSIKEFVPAKGVPGLSINRLGEMVCSITGKIVASTTPKSKSRYPMYSYNGYKGSVHRLVALTFIDQPTDKPIVNHLDGNKSNFRWDNLEWTTYSGNSQHAYDSGLRDENIPVLVKDLRDDSVVEYNSYGKAAEFFGFAAAKILHLLKPHRRGKIFHRFYGIIRKGDTWPTFDKRIVGFTINGEAKSIIGKKLGDPTVYRFESTGQAAYMVGFKSSTLAMRFIRAAKKNKTTVNVGEWTFEQEQKGLIKTIAKLIEADHRRSREFYPRKPVPIKVTNLETGEIRFMESCLQLAKELGIRKSTLQCRMNSNDGVWTRGKLKLRIEYI